MNPVKTLLAKYNSMSVQSKAAAWYTVCNILQKGISFIAVPIYVRLLTTAEYGRYTVFQSWLEILVIFATLNLYCGVFTKAMVDHSDDRYRYTSSMQTLSTLITSVMFAVYLLAGDFWNKLLDLNTATFLLMFAYFVFYPALQFWSVHQRVVYRYKSMVAVTLLVSLLVPILSIILLKTTNLREQAVIMGNLLIQIAVGMFFYIYNYVRGKCIFHKLYWVSAIRFNIPLIPHYLSLIALAQVDRIMIKEMCDDAKAGIYSFTTSISSLMSIFISAINSAIVPWIYESLKAKACDGLAKVCTAITFLLGVMTFGVILIAPEIVSILGTKDYMDAIWVIPPLSVGMFFTFCYGLFSNVEFYYSATKYVMMASVAAATVKCGLNLVFIPMFGYLAAGYTTLLCYILLTITHYFVMRKLIRVKLGNIQVYDIKTIFVLCGGMIATMCVALILYQNIFARYTAILLVLVLLVVFRKKVIAVARQLM